MNSVHQLPTLIWVQTLLAIHLGKLHLNTLGFFSTSRCWRDFGNIHSAFDLLSVLEKAVFVLSMVRLWAKYSWSAQRDAEACKVALL